MKKMVIIPFRQLEEIERWKKQQFNKPHLPPNPEIMYASNSFKELNSVFDKNISESEKAQMHASNLVKYFAIRVFHSRIRQVLMYQLNFISVGRKLQKKNKATYFTQIIVIYAIIITSIVYIKLESPNKELWLILLSSSLGYILPTPALKYLKNPPSQEKK